MVPARRERTGGALGVAGSSHQCQVWDPWAPGHLGRGPSPGSSAGLGVKPEKCQPGPYVTVTNNPQASWFKTTLSSHFPWSSEYGSPRCLWHWVSPGGGLGGSHLSLRVGPGLLSGCWLDSAPPGPECLRSSKPGAWRQPSVPSHVSLSPGQLRTWWPAPSEGTIEKSQRETSHHSCGFLQLEGATRSSPHQGEGGPLQQEYQEEGTLGGHLRRLPRPLVTRKALLLC